MTKVWDMPSKKLAKRLKQHEKRMVRHVELPWEPWDYMIDECAALMDGHEAQGTPREEAHRQLRALVKGRMQRYAEEYAELLRQQKDDKLSLDQRLARAKHRLASVRDELRNITAEAEACSDSAGRGIEELERATEILSEHV